MIASDVDLVSTIIPAYNSERTLEATIRSARAQSWTQLEIIVVDDGSSDGTADVAARAAAEDRRVRVLSQANAGVAAARNVGIDAARGAHVATIDADDLWHPRKIEFQMQVVKRSARRLGFVYAWSRRINARDGVIADQGRPTHRGDVYAQLATGNFLRNASCVLMPRDAALDVGGFDTGLRAAGAQGAEDLKLYLALAERHPVDLTPLFLVGYRTSSHSMSSSVLAMRRSIELVLEEIQARRVVPDGILDLSRLNYDLYAAKLALQSRRLPLAARFTADALARGPATAVNLLGVAAAGRVFESWAALFGLRSFESLDPAKTAFPPWFGDRLEAILSTGTRSSLSDEAGCGSAVPTLVRKPGAPGTD